MTKVVVTGANGFIGAHLAEQLLAAGNEVTCLVRSPERLPQQVRRRVRTVQGDIRDSAAVRAAVADAEQVFHIAGLVKALSVAELFAVNADGARVVAEACAAQETPPTLIVASSLAAAGPSRDGRPVQETDVPAPVSNYGRSKLAGEAAVRTFAERMPISIIRPAVVFGPGDPNSFAMIRPIARFGIHPVPGGGPLGSISAIHVADLCRLLMLVAERGRRLTRSGEADPSRGIYFGADPTAVRYDEFGKLIGAAMGRDRIRVMRNSRLLGFTLAGLAESIARLRRQAAIISVDKMREAFAGSWHCSGERAERELGFRPAAPLAERIAETVAWYRAEGWLPRAIPLFTPLPRPTGIPVKSC
jgi:nucleoside-diphosphate-sugar epimerase